MRKKQYAEAFRWALNYLLNDWGFSGSQLAKGLSLHPSTVGRWIKEESFPQSLDHILAVIGKAIIYYRHMQLIEEWDQKLNEFPFPAGGLQWVTNYLIEEKGYKPEELSDLGKKVCDVRTIKSYRMGRKPKMVKYQPFTSLPVTAMVPYETATEILGQYAVETGMREEVFYALSTIAWRYLDVLTYDIGTSRLKDIEDWCKIYEKRKAFS